MPTFVKLLLGIVLPPVAVFLTCGLSVTLFINIALTVIGWIPGSIHAVWVITKQAEKADQAGSTT